MNNNVGKAEMIRKDILSRKRKYGTIKALERDKITSKTTVALKCFREQCELVTPVRSTQCLQPSCLYELESIVSMFASIDESSNYTSEKCNSCNVVLDPKTFYQDLDLIKVIKNLKEQVPDEYELLIFDASKLNVMVNRSNKWTLENEQGQVELLILQSESQVEYEANYPTYPSQQIPEFYINGYVFAHENVEKFVKDKLQAYVALFFPSILEKQNRWREVYVYENKDITYFNKWMTVCRVFDPFKKQHLLMATGGYGYPTESQYEDRSFLVPLFKSNPEAEIPPETKVQIQNIQRMKSPRVCHGLVQLKNYVYAIGGDRRDFEKNIDFPLRSCERYDLKEEKWEEISMMSKPRQMFSTLVYAEKIFVIGGKLENQQRQLYDEESIEVLDPNTLQWSSYSINYGPDKSFLYTERPLSFVGKDDNIIIFGGRKQAKQQKGEQCPRSRQCVEVCMATSQHRFTERYLPELGLPLENQTDFQGIYYNGRFIFGYKQQKIDPRKISFTPSIYKYNENAADEDVFVSEHWRTMEF